MAMLRVVSDALIGADVGQVTLTALLDLMAAFDCVDHALLICRLQYNFDLKDDVLNWMTSFVIGRTQQASYDGQLSPICPVQFRVLQGSILVPCSSCCAVGSDRREPGRRQTQSAPAPICGRLSSLRDDVHR